MEPGPVMPGAPRVWSRSGDLFSPEVLESPGPCFVSLCTLQFSDLRNDKNTWFFKVTVHTLWVVSDFCWAPSESPIPFGNNAVTDQNVTGTPLRTHRQINRKYLIQENAGSTLYTNKGTLKYSVKKNLNVRMSKGAISEDVWEQKTLICIQPLWWPYFQNFISLAHSHSLGLFSF